MQSVVPWRLPLLLHMLPCLRIQTAAVLLRQLRSNLPLQVHRAAWLLPPPPLLLL
jgi:hypothetical protein